MRLLLLTVFLSLFTLLQAENNSLSCATHYMWGLWDTTPLPSKYQAIQAKNSKLLGSQPITHGKEEVFEWIQRFSEEYDPDFFTLFSKIPRKVSQADLGRYVMIYYLGGLYLDIDVNIKDPKPLFSSPYSPNGVWFMEDIADKSRLGVREKPYSNRIAQYAFYVEDKLSPLLLEIILESISRVKTLFLEQGDSWSDQDVLWATGPDVVTTVLHETKLKGFTIVTLKKSRTILHHGAHSSWRKQKDQ